MAEKGVGRSWLDRVPSNEGLDVLSDRQNKRVGAGPARDLE
jgi:hypothetical protein